MEGTNMLSKKSPAGASVSLVPTIKLDNTPCIPEWAVYYISFTTFKL